MALCLARLLPRTAKMRLPTQVVWDRLFLNHTKLHSKGRLQVLLLSIQMHSYWAKVWTAGLTLRSLDGENLEPRMPSSWLTSLEMSDAVIHGPSTNTRRRLICEHLQLLLKPNQSHTCHASTKAFSLCENEILRATCFSHLAVESTTWSTALRNNLNYDIRGRSNSAAF